MLLLICSWYHNLYSVLQEEDASGEGRQLAAVLVLRFFTEMEIDYVATKREC